VRFGADFDALIARFSPDTKRPLAVAVSGGSDSLALLSLTDEWASRHQRDLVVFTVDHQLRAEARAEAASVAALTKQLGHDHETLVWDDPKPSQSAARTARYRLICQRLQDIGACGLLLGHTLDDVVETALIRRRRGVRDATIAGPTLAAAAPCWPEGRDVSLLRPLIETSRLELRQHLQNRGWSWSEDPSNESSSYERIRVRQFLERHPGLRAISTQFVRDLLCRRVRDDQSLGQTLEQVRVGPDGLIDTGDAEISARLLTLLARCAAGGDTDPRAHAVRALIDDMNTPGDRQTLAGAWFQRTATGLLIGRDPGTATEREVQKVFDGRFIRASDTRLPDPADQAFLVRHATPPDQTWRELISERLTHIALCLQTEALHPVIYRA